MLRCGRSPHPPSCRAYSFRLNPLNAKRPAACAACPYFKKWLAVRVTLATEIVCPVAKVLACLEDVTAGVDEERFGHTEAGRT